MSIWCYTFTNAWNVAFLWVFLVFGSGAWTSVMIVRRNQQQIAEMAAQGATRMEQVLRNGQWIEVPATELVLGDVLQVADGVASADLVLVSGCAVVNESMLTGEPMPLQKVAVEPMNPLPFDYQAHGKKHGIFAGTEVLQSVADEGSNSNRGSTVAVGVVMAIGGRTTKGKLIRMVLYPAAVKFKYTEQLPIVYSFMTIWAVICLAATLRYQGQGWVTGCFSGLAFLTQALNPMMAVSFTLGQSCAASRLKENSISCLNIGRIPIAGKIRTMVFDKTGTITHGGMDLAAVMPVVNGQFQEEVPASELPGLQEEIFLKALGGSDQSQRPKLETPATKGKSKTRGIAENDFKVKAACASKALPIEKLDRETVPGNWIAQSTGRSQFLGGAFGNDPSPCSSKSIESIESTERSKVPPSESRSEGARLMGARLSHQRTSMEQLVSK
ncbi:unnamed protein product [Durusdinium trenchii]|uniref:P-type ATPase A domain-containing protein n=1 Tax=Durusdinium trenchii TaxID=1381693 RepID=A0ABP0SEV6_9DINO